MPRIITWWITPGASNLASLAWWSLYLIFTSILIDFFMDPIILRTIDTFHVISRREHREHRAEIFDFDKISVPQWTLRDIIFLLFLLYIEHEQLHFIIIELMNICVPSHKIASYQLLRKKPAILRPDSRKIAGHIFTFLLFSRCIDFCERQAGIKKIINKS